jgi:hypothetical protein
VVLFLWRRLLIMSQPAVQTIIWERRSSLTDNWKVGVSATEKNRRIAIDEELLITGVSVSGENQRVLNGGVSAS